MGKFIAIAKAYHGGVIVEVGTPVDWPEGAKLPSWLAADNPAAKSEAVAAPVGNWEAAPVKPVKLTAAQQKAADKATKKAGATIAALNTEPFADAPAPVRVENEVNDALGTTQPDWVAPAGGSMAVSD